MTIKEKSLVRFIKEDSWHGKTIPVGQVGIVTEVFPNPDLVTVDGDFLVYTENLEVIASPREITGKTVPKPMSITVPEIREVIHRYACIYDEDANSILAALGGYLDGLEEGGIRK